jgi:glyoxylase-like metal-dependent hydrolase (beta-lactamase superfamily II)
MRVIGPDAFEITVPMPLFPGARPGAKQNVTHVYLSRQRMGWVLVDTGFDWDGGWERFTREVRETGVALAEIKRAIVTHEHRDHLGLAHRLQAAARTEIALHVNDAPEKVRGHFYNSDTARVAKALAAIGVPEQVIDEYWKRHHEREDQYLNVRVDIPIDGRETVLPDLPEMKLIWTPGHTVGHVSVLDVKRRFLYSGDHVLPHITPSVQFYPMGEGDPLGEFVESLQYIRDLDVEMVHPAHGSSFPNLAGRVDEILHHHEERLVEMEGAVAGGAVTAWDIASRVRWNTGAWDKIRLRIQLMALNETLAHIRYLVHRGRLIEKQENGRIVYVRPVGATA